MTRKLGIEFVREFVESKGGHLLSNKYQNVSTPLDIKCPNSHVWTSSYDSLRKNSWCPYCSKKAKLSIHVARSVANERGGRLLSSKYKNNKVPLEWECQFGHRWKACLSDVKNGKTWCPECSSGLYERICRKYFECMFLKKFPKLRPFWLVNDAGNRMELDGYCEPLGIAFEHNGLQHYQETYINAPLVNRKKMDAKKRELCAQRGILLIEIPQLVTCTPIDNLPQLIVEKCGDMIPNPSGRPDLSEIYSSELNQCHDIAKQNNGKCLSNTYIGCHSKLQWECFKGHRWRDTPANVKHGRLWCPTCRIYNRQTQKLAEMRKLAASRGGKCLSLEYTRADVNMKWMCKNGHEWFARPANVKRGNWCQNCHIERLARQK